MGQVDERDTIEPSVPAVPTRIDHRAVFSDGEVEELAVRGERSRDADEVVHAD